MRQTSESDGPHLGNSGDKDLASAFGARGFSVNTLSELQAALADIDQLTDEPALVEVKLDTHDLPAELRATLPGASNELAPAGFAEPEAATTIAPAGFN